MRTTPRISFFVAAADLAHYHFGDRVRYSLRSSKGGQMPEFARKFSGVAVIADRKLGRGRIFESIADTIGDTPIVRLSRLPQAMGVEAERSLRVSVGWSTSDADVDAFGVAFPQVVEKLRALRG